MEREAGGRWVPTIVIPEGSVAEPYIAAVKGALPPGDVVDILVVGSDQLRQILAQVPEAPLAASAVPRGGEDTAGTDQRTR